jgi:hypothetical protein
MMGVEEDSMKQATVNFTVDRIAKLKTRAGRVRALDAVRERDPVTAIHAEIELRRMGLVTIADHHGWRSWLARHGCPEV